ncbi:MAG: histone deacetylase, partial [Deltaproteobacteria bacterium]
VGQGNVEYVGIFERILKPIALEFDPDLVLVSAGFDIYANDPLGGMRVTAEGFAGMTRCLMDIAQSCCEGKLVITLEGGYNLQGLRECGKAVLEEMMDLAQTKTEDILSKGPHTALEEIVRQVASVQGRYWKALA